jgi:hypothetical protein
MTQASSQKDASPPVALKPGGEASGRVAAEVTLQQSSRQARAVSLVREAALLPVVVVLIIVGSLVSNVFLTVSNFSGIGLQASALGVV